MTYYNRDNIISAIKNFCNLPCIECYGEMEGFNFGFIYDIVVDIQKKYPFIRIIPYNKNGEIGITTVDNFNKIGEDIKVQIVYGPFYICTIKPLVNTMCFSSVEKGVHQLSSISFTLKSRTKKCERAYIDLPDKCRDKIIREIIMFEQQTSKKLNFDIEREGSYSLNIKKRTIDVERPNDYESSEIIVNRIITIGIECILNDSEFKDIIKATGLLQKIKEVD